MLFETSKCMGIKKPRPDFSERGLVFQSHEKIEIVPALQDTKQM